MVDTNFSVSAIEVPEAERLLEVRNLKMWFTRRKGFVGRNISYVKAVDDVSISIRKRETLGLVGEGGCGKTTVGRCIMRVYEPTSGDIIYYDETPKANGAGKAKPVNLAKMTSQELKPYRQDIRMIFQDPYSS